MVNNPMPAKKPTKEDFCWVIWMFGQEKWVGMHPEFIGHIFSTRSPIKPPDMPFRPVKLADSGMKLSKYHVAALEHVKDAYRLYFYGDEARGVFRGDESADIVPASIPIEDEYTKFAGILIYNKEAYEREMRLWKQYWGWKENRNEARWRDQDGKENPVDFKSMMHCLRLLYSGENIAMNGEPIVRFTGDKLQRLRDVRAGLVPHEELLAEAEERLAKLDEAKETCALPDAPDYNVINELSIKLHRDE